MLDLQNLKLDGTPRKISLKHGECEWTPERVARLKQMWADGCSQNEIAHDLGLHSRGAVSGKIARLGLSRPQIKSPVARGQPRKPKGLQFAEIAWSAVIMPEGRLTLEQLTDATCHFPVGDGPNYLFCGEPTTAAPYCRACARIAYR